MTRDCLKFNIDSSLGSDGDIFALFFRALCLQILKTLIVRFQFSVQISHLTMWDPIMFEKCEITTLS